MLGFGMFLFGLIFSIGIQFLERIKEHIGARYLYYGIFQKICEGFNAAVYYTN
jgi:hypothetical protein